MTYSEPRSICTFFQIPHSCELIRLSFSPTIPSDLHYYLSSMSCDLSRRSFRIRKLPCRLWLYLRVEYRLFHSVGLLVSFAAVLIRYTYRLAPWLLYLLGDLTNDVAYLPGLPLRVPRRLRKVRDSNSRSVLPLASLAVRCFRPLSQPSQYVYPDCALCFRNQRTSRRAGNE